MGDVWGKMKGEQVNHEYIIFSDTEKRSHLCE